MLGRTASSLFWMTRYMERAENIARLTQVGHRISMTPDSTGGYREDWKSTLASAGCLDAFAARGTTLSAAEAQRFLVFDRDHPSSIRACLEAARNNGRSVRTALTREMWEALNSTWIAFAAIDPAGVGPGAMAELLDWVRQRSGQFRGAMLGSLLRDEGFHFCQLGTFIERADNTARILEVKYNVLLPAYEAMGGERDLHQWDTILRSLSAVSAYRYFYRDRIRPRTLAEFLMLRPEMPRSLRFCCDFIAPSLASLATMTGGGTQSLPVGEALASDMRVADLDDILRGGLREYLGEFLNRNAAVAQATAADYHFD
ncbi:MAG: alpha-E domain-containing protein [Acetobacteraceae bacterium]|nr:alpha-E domain-containing protein [Acetobacteraceae bacterium]